MGRLTIFLRPCNTAGVLLLALGALAANAGNAQSVSEADYLDALDGLVQDMDLEQPTNESQPADSGAETSLQDCATLLAQNGAGLVVVAEDRQFSDDDLAALVECYMPSTGAVRRVLPRDQAGPGAPALQGGS